MGHYGNKVSDVITIYHATFHAHGNRKEGNINYELKGRNDRCVWDLDAVSENYL